MNELVIQVILVVCFILLLVTFIVLFIVLYQRRHNRYLQEKLALQSRYQQGILEAQLEIQEQTLKNISQEIHDNIGQVLSLVKLNMNTIPVSQEGIGKLNDTKNLVAKAINDLRDLSRSMHGGRIAEAGLQASLENELQIIQNTGHFKTELTTTGEPYRLNTQKEMVLFRIAQEALNNAIKYSKAKNIIISLDYGHTNFSLTVHDDGDGFDISQLQNEQSGIGLKSMQDRASLIDGRFSLFSTPKKGVTVMVALENL